MPKVTLTNDDGTTREYTDFVLVGLEPKELVLPGQPVKARPVKILQAFKDCPYPDIRRVGLGCVLMANEIEKRCNAATKPGTGKHHRN